jgi:ribosome recycling factor
MIVIQPWDGGMVDAVRKAIEESKLGISPIVDGNKIRLPIPQLSQERRVDLVKTIKRIGEEGRVAIRGIRRNAMDDLKKIQKDGKITEDELKGSEKDVQKLTDDHVALLEKHLAQKEAELMKV